MKTRTLLLLSVGTALMILVAGGVLLFQLAGQDETLPINGVGDTASVGDALITVLAVDGTEERFSIDVEFGGVDDDLGGFTLLTGDETLSPLAAPDEGRCAALTVALQRCRLDFDTGTAQGSNRLLLVIRGDDRESWNFQR